jgi:hypothetical protein
MSPTQEAIAAPFQDLNVALGPPPMQPAAHVRGKTDAADALLLRLPIRHVARGCHVAAVEAGAAVVLKPGLVCGWQARVGIDDAIMPTRRNATSSLNIGHYFRIAPDQRL